MANSNIEHNIHTQQSGEEATDNGIGILIKQAVQSTLFFESVDLPCAVNILITDDKEIRKYNNEYRDIDSATDVLSFPMQTFKRSGWSEINNIELDEDTGEVPLGDIIISEESVKRQAGEYGNTAEHEMAYLIIHSTLHLLGYDHDTKDNEKFMHGKNKSILQEMSFDINDK